MNTLPNVLKELRKSKGMTQKEVAEKLNITDRTYGHYETGKREPSIDMLIEIAKYYNISIDILVGRYKEIANDWFYSKCNSYTDYDINVCNTNCTNSNYSIKNS